MVSFIYNTRLYAPFKWFGIALFSQISIKKTSNSSIPVLELRASRVQVIQRWSDLQNQIWEDKSDESHINEKQKSGGASTVWADLLKTARSSLWLYSHCRFWVKASKQFMSIFCWGFCLNWDIQYIYHAFFFYETSYISTWPETKVNRNHKLDSTRASRTKTMHFCKPATELYKTDATLHNLNQ